jgi:group I intron endonuclease
MGGIYKITNNTTGQIYVGSAKNFDRRWGDHQAQLLLNKHCNKNLQNSFNKHGLIVFSFEIVKILEPYNKEIYFKEENITMELFRSLGISLFNIAKAEGGWGPETFLRKAEICKKISTTLQAYYDSLSVDERNKIYGKGRRGKPMSDAHKTKTSLGLTGQTKSAETKIKMSIAQKKLNSVERSNIMSEIGKANRGKPGHTPGNANAFYIFGKIYTSGMTAMKELNLTRKQLKEMENNGTAKRNYKEEKDKF